MRQSHLRTAISPPPKRRTSAPVDRMHRLMTAHSHPRNKSATRRRPNSPCTSRRAWCRSNASCSRTWERHSDRSPGSSCSRDPSASSQRLYVDNKNPAGTASCTPCSVGGSRRLHRFRCRLPFRSRCLRSRSIHRWTIRRRVSRRSTHPHSRWEPRHMRSPRRRPERRSRSSHHCGGGGGGISLMPAPAVVTCSHWPIVAEFAAATRGTASSLVPVHCSR